MEIIDHLDARGIEWVSLSTEEISIVCPNAASHQDGRDAKPSFNINLEGRGAHCFACGYSMKPEALVKWLAGEDLDELDLQVMSLRAKSRRLSQSSANSLFCESFEVFLPPGDPWDQDGFRGISLETYRTLGALRVTRGRYADRIAFPVRVNGELKGIDARALLPDMVPKYLRNYKCSCRTDWLYPYDIVMGQQPELLLLGEGIFHAINAYDKGYSGLCFFGVNNWSKTKLRMLLATGATEICFFRDRDKAGLKAEQVIGAELAEYFKVTSAFLDEAPEGADMGDLTQEQMDQAVAHRTPAMIPKCLPHEGKQAIVMGASCRQRRCPYNHNRQCLNAAWV